MNTIKKIALFIIPLILLIVAISGCTSSNNTNNDTNSQSTSSSSSSGTVLVKIITSGNWSGSVGDGSTSKTIEGKGNYQQDMGSAQTVSANIQKQTNSSDTLTVQILQNGKVIKQESTSAQYGVVTVSASL